MEITILLCVAVLLIVLWTVAIGNDTLDVTLHDTYLVISHTKEKIFVFPILLLITGFYFIREAFYSYRRVFQNLVALICVFFINLILLFWVNFFHILTSKIDGHKGGWSIYPPLSALPKTLPENPLPHSSLFHDIWQIVLFIQIIFLLLLIVIAVLTGKSLHIKQSET